MNKKRDVYILIFLIVVFVGINYRFIDNYLVKNFDSKELVFADRVVDGDTIIVNGSSVRLLGINTPEKGEVFYEEAKEFLEEKVMGKSFFIERYGKDKYYRDLAYIFDFDSKENINLEIVKNGYGNYYFPSGKDGYSEEFFDAWKKCLNSGINLCEKSSDVCASCVVLESFDFGKDEVVLKNVCSFDCSLSGWSLKDEGRKKFVFDNFVLRSQEKVIVTNEDFGKDYVWTSSGDTLFLRDSENKLVLWERKGY